MITNILNGVLKRLLYTTRYPAVPINMTFSLTIVLFKYNILLFNPQKRKPDQKFENLLSLFFKKIQWVNEKEEVSRTTVDKHK